MKRLLLAALVLAVGFTQLSSATAGTTTHVTAAWKWTPSSNAKVSTATLSDKSWAASLKPKTTKKQTVSLTSGDWMTAPVSGSTVKATAWVKSGQAGRKVTLRIYEISDGKTIANRTTSWTSTKAAKTASVSIKTSRPNSRLKLRVWHHGVSKKRALLVKSVELKVDSPTPTATPTPTPSPTPVPAACKDINYSDPAQGKLTFSEDFNGNSLDPTKWRVRDNTFLNHDKAWISKDNVTVHDGYLDIMGKKLPANQVKNNPNGIYPGENTIRDYSTGYVDTIDSAGYGNSAGNRFAQKYGYFEVRAWVPSEGSMSRGIWPAFWLRGDKEAGELDVMESYGAPTINAYDHSSTYEWNSWADTSQSTSKDHTQGTANVGSDKIWQGWHRYGVNWSPNCMRYLYDGKTVGFVDFTDPKTKSYFKGDTFNDTFHLRLNMQIGSKYWGWPDDQHTRPEFHFKIDSVKVYQGLGN